MTSDEPLQVAAALRAQQARARILATLATMPDEAFDWFALACAPSAMLHGAHAQIWPDGIGGFTEESRAAITATRDAAAVYLKAHDA